MSEQQRWKQTRSVRARVDTTSFSSEHRGQDVLGASSTEIASRQEQQLTRMPSFATSYPASSFRDLLTNTNVSTHLFGQFGQASPRIPLIGEGTFLQSGPSLHQVNGFVRTIPSLGVEVGDRVHSPHANGGMPSGSDPLDTSSREKDLPHRDPPSGPPLCHDPQVRDYVPEEEDFPGDDVDPGVSKGRGPTKAVPEQDRYEKRIFVEQAVAEVRFEDKRANKAISALLRINYKGEKKWKEVSRQTRDILWQSFGMRFRWDSSKHKEIVDLWDKVNDSCFTNMISSAKRDWENEKKRPKWCSIRRFNHLVRYWKTPEVREDSLKHSENRGAVRNAEGEVVKKAPATFTGGSISMLRLDKNLAGNSSTANVLTIQNFKATHMTGLKKKGKRKSQEGVDGASGSSQIESESSISEAPKWIQPKFGEIVERYNELTAMKYADRPEDKPEEWQPRDEECWNEATGGPKNNKVIGVTNHAILQKLGYKTNMRMSRTDVQLTAESIENSIQKTLETAYTRFDEERQSYQSQITELLQDRQSYQSQLIELHRETQENRRLINELLAKSPGVDLPHPPPSDAVGHDQ